MLIAYLSDQKEFFFLRGYLLDIVAWDFLGFGRWGLGVEIGDVGVCFRGGREGQEGWRMGWDGIGG